MKVHTNIPLENAEAELEAFLAKAPGMLGDCDFTPSMLRYNSGDMEGRFVEPCVASGWMMYQVRARKAHEDELASRQLAQLQLADVQRLDKYINGPALTSAKPSSLADLVAQFEDGSTLPLHVSSFLAEDSRHLIKRFAVALAEKMRDAERKYGRATEWRNSNWEEQCGADLLEHLKKGDPRDVAIYCAFMWYHGWETDQIKGVKAFDVTDAIGEAVKAALTDGISKMLSDPALLAALTQTPATGDKPE